MKDLVLSRQQVAEQLATVQDEVNYLSKNNSLVSSLSAANAMFLLDQVLTDEVIRTYYLPLMNTRAGFLTDRNPNKPRRGQQPPTPYSIPEVRACLKEAIIKGLLPTGNQFNIIAGGVYITREGYTYLLSRMGVKHRIVTSQLADRDGYAVCNCRIEAKTSNGERISYTNEVLFKRGQFDSDDLLRGKAYARSVKSLWTYVTGLDAGDVVEDSNERVIEDAVAQPVQPAPSHEADRVPASAKVQAAAEPIPAGRRVAEPIQVAAPSPVPTPAAKQATKSECPF